MTENPNETRNQNVVNATYNMVMYRQCFVVCIVHYLSLSGHQRKLATLNDTECSRLYSHSALISLASKLIETVETVVAFLDAILNLPIGHQLSACVCNSDPPFIFFVR